MGDELFQNFLKQLGENVSEDEVKSLSAACQEVIPNDDREKIQKHGELFDYLQKIGKLSKDDLSYLEHALEKICRPDLVTQIMEFREQLGCDSSDNNNPADQISGPARKYKAMNKETGEVPEDIISGLTKLELAPPPTQATRKKLKDSR